MFTSDHFDNLLTAATNDGYNQGFDDGVASTMDKAIRITEGIGHEPTVEALRAMLALWQEHKQDGEQARRELARGAAGSLREALTFFREHQP